MFKKMTSFWEMIFSSGEEEKVNYCKNIHRNKKDVTPSYVEISKDLNSKENQVFEASVYYLCVIAKMKQEYQKDISEIVNMYLNKNKAKTSRVSYVLEMAKEHGLDEFIHN